MDPRDHLLMASAAIMTIPVLVLFAVAQRYFISGVVLSGFQPSGGVRRANGRDNCQHHSRSGVGVTGRSPGGDYR